MIRKLLIRLLRFFVKLGFIGKVTSFKYSGKAFSLNDFYAGGNWYARQSIKNEYKPIFEKLIQQADKGKLYFEKFYLLIFFNTRHDVDNVMGMEKIFIDTLKGNIIKEDNKTHYKGLMVFYDKLLPMNTFEFILIELKDVE